MKLFQSMSAELVRMLEKEAPPSRLELETMIFTDCQSNQST